jgi:hypothetical protein
MKNQESKIKLQEELATLRKDFSDLWSDLTIDDSFVERSDEVDVFLAKAEELEQKIDSL